MSIKFRRGNESDLDKTKLTPAEPVITLDSKKAFLAFAPGDTKQLLTSEDAGDIVALSETMEEQLESLEQLVVSKAGINDASTNTTQTWSSSNISMQLNEIVADVTIDSEVILARNSSLYGKYVALDDRLENIEAREKEDTDELSTEIYDIWEKIGYSDDNIFGVEVDMVNKTFTRIAGSVGKTEGANFDSIRAFGGRKRCNVTDNGVVLNYFGDSSYSETGALLSQVVKGGVTYPVGTKVQVMVEQPKFYYKVTPLTLGRTEFKEINTVAVTNGATSSGDITINLDGISVVVAVVSGDSATTVATKIRNATYSGWVASGSGTSVVFTCNVVGTKVTATVNNALTGVTSTVTKTQPGYIGKGYHLRKARYYVSDINRLGFKTHPAFISDGIEREFVYLSAYEASLYDVSASAYILNDAQVADFTVTTGDKMCSIANAKPMSGLTQNLIRTNTRKLAQNRGIGWQQAYTATVAASHLLMLIEYASFNMQSKIGNGAVSKVDDGTTNRSEPTGATALLGNASGIAVNTNGIQFVSYRGEENFWGNIWGWVDGINIYANNEQSVYVADNGFTDDVGTSPYSDVGFTGAKREGYVSAFGYSEGFDWLFYPSETFGDSNLPVGDHHWLNSQPNSWFVGLLGGSWSIGSTAGAFSWNVSAASSARYRHVGGRLVYVPSAVA